MHATTIVSWITVIRSTLEDYEVTADDVLLKAGIRPDQLHDPSARIPASQVTHLWHLAVQLTGDPCFGLAVAKAWHPTAFHALGFAWLASETLLEGLQRLVRYSRLVSTLARLELTTDDEVCELRIERDPLFAGYLDPAPAAMDAGLGSIIRMCRMATGEEYRPLEIVMPTKNPACLNRYRRFLGAPVRFEPERLAIRFAMAGLTAPLPTANRELAHLNEQVVARYVAQLDRDDIAMRVKAFLVDKLPSGTVEEETVARHLHLSLRSLQRRLHDQGTSYKTLLTQTRQELAKRYLRNTHLPVSEISFLLGFSELPSFSRAFRRWFGLSPSAFREIQ